MVLVPSGSFQMGCASGDSKCKDDEKPRHEVALDAFYIDTTEVTVAAYRSCNSAGECTTPATDSRYCNWGKSGRDRHPINCVDHGQATAYCGWKNKRLPTEAEWEKAARGTDGRIYPWGNQSPSCSLAIMKNSSNYGCGEVRTWPVGSKPAGKSPYGALDMSGNVWEWVSDWYDKSYYASSSRSNPSGPSGGSSRVFRGGSWYDDDGSNDYLRASTRRGFAPDFRYNSVGFRCARPLR